MMVKVGKTSDFVEGRLKGVEVNGRLLVIGRYKGELNAMDGHCSHMGYELTKGKFIGGVVTCPLHGAEFELKSGKKLMHAGAKDLRVYPVLVKGEDVLLEL